MFTFFFNMSNLKTQIIKHIVVVVVIIPQPNNLLLVQVPDFEWSSLKIVMMITTSSYQIQKPS